MPHSLPSDQITTDGWFLCRSISSTSSSMSRSVTARPRSGWNSCRLTPLNSTRFPFTVSTPLSMATVRKPTRVRTVPPGAVSVASYSRGTSALHGSTSATAASSPVASSRPSSGTTTVPATSASTRNVPLPSRWSYDACTNTSRGASGRCASSVTSRKIPDSHHWSWSSRYDPADHWCTRTTTSASSPGATCSVMSNSLGSRLPLDHPTFEPFTQTVNRESTPSN